MTRYLNKKRIAILGSTGSVGTQALDIIRRFPDQFRAIALSAGTNIDGLKKQIKEFQPDFVSVKTKELACKLASEVSIPVHFGVDGLVKVAVAEEADILLTSVVGSVGLRPTLAAIKTSKTIALANKETLVTAGDLVMVEARKNKALLLPVDSEHSALFQALNGENIERVKRLIITCSGGSFRRKTRGELDNVTVADALAHPNWNMGGKITIDSATLMNKGLEVIEAHHLFNMPYDKIEVVVHPQSIIHSMVEFVDGSVMAQLAVPDMRLPILYAFSYPDRLLLDLPGLDFAKIRELTFHRPDLETFPCLAYAIEAGRMGGTMPCVLNAANEMTVEYFLAGKIKFLDIPRLVRRMMDKHQLIKNPGIEEIMAVDRDVRERIAQEL